MDAGAGLDWKGFWLELFEVGQENVLLVTGLRAAARGDAEARELFLDLARASIELASSTLPGRNAGQVKRDSFLFHLHGETAALQGLADAVAEFDQVSK